MRICHFSDSHLGAGEGYPRRGSSGLTLRQQDIIDSFVRTVDAVIDLRPDVCLYAGDLFHTVRPINRIMSIAGEHLHRLAVQSAIPTVIISGNHDAPKQPHLGAALDVYRQFENLYVSAGIGLQIFEIGGAKFFALPHCLTAQIQKEELIRCLPGPAARYNILIAHGVAAGMEEFSMAELGEQELPLEVLNRFDYTALGHYHNSRQVGSGRVWYSGSTERLSQAEREADKGFLEINLEPFGVTFHKIACRGMVDIQPINAAGKRGDQLAAIIKEKIESVGSSDKIIRIKVQGVTEETLKTLPVDVITSLKQDAFSLDIKFEKARENNDRLKFGRSAIGRLDQGFLQFLEIVDLEGFDRERLKREAQKYLSEE